MSKSPNTWATYPHSTLAKPAASGTEYADAHTTTSSDSFPGTLAFATGGTPSFPGSSWLGDSPSGRAKR
ncbi:MAG TPA: hypothetical protein VLC06_09670 [Polyangia bacterium]|nr:hypothetical protein [Polyangia bacterium]